MNQLFPLYRDFSEEENPSSLDSFVDLFYAISGFEDKINKNTGKYNLIWNNTERQGEIIFLRGDQYKQDQEIDPVRDNNDFKIIIFLPQSKNKIDNKNLLKKWISDPGILFWLPENLNSVELDLFSKYFSTGKEEFKPKIIEIIERVYWGGIIGNRTHKYSGLKKKKAGPIFDKLINEQLNQLYSRHPKIPQEINSLSPEEILQLLQSTKLIDLFKNLIEEEYFSIKKDIFPYLRRSPFGLTEDLFKLLLIETCLTGEYRLFDNNGDLIIGENLSREYYQQLYPEINLIVKGQIINEFHWEKYLKIIQAFKLNLTDQRRTINNQDFIWKNIITIQKNWLEDIEQAIRINSQLCYLLEEEQQIKDVNLPLFKLHHLLDQDFYQDDQDSYPGLKKFLKTLEQIYGNLPIFLDNLQAVEAILTFIKKRYDQLLIQEYKYLKHISLPLRGYESLRIALFTVLKKFNHLSSIIAEPSAITEILKDINKFQKLYLERYTEEHNAYQNELITFNLKLHSLPEYKALEILSKIRVVKVAYNLKPIKKYIDTFFPEQCLVNQFDEILDKQPRCNCGFTIGESLTIPSLHKITPMLKKGIKEYIGQLQKTNHFREMIITYLKYNPQSTLQNILEADIEDINSLLPLITPGLVGEINEALSSTFPLKISVQQLAEGLVGSYPADQLQIISEKVEARIKELIKTNFSDSIKPEPEQIIINLVK